jgi:hypothetical protein
MKHAVSVLLLGSIALNAVLFFRRDAAHPRASESSPAAQAAQTSPASTDATTASAASAVFPADLSQRLRAGDATAVQLLRRLGLSEKIIRALVRAEIDEAYRARENALYTPPEKLEYWKAQYMTDRYYPTDRLALADLRREKEGLLRTLLGPEYRQEENKWDTRYAFLPPAKIDAVRDIAEDYDAMDRKIRGDGSVLFKADAEKLAYLRKEKLAELAQILSPAELEEYEMRNSQTGMILRYAFNNFAGNETEFRALFKIYNSYAEKNGNPPQVIDSGLLNGGSADAAFNAEVKAALGEQRYQEFARARDYEFVIMSTIAERTGVPADKISQAYTFTKSLGERGRAMMQQSFDNVDKVNEARAALANEAKQTLLPLLGEKAYAVYVKQSPTLRSVAMPIPKPPAKPKQG